MLTLATMSLLLAAAPAPAKPPAPAVHGDFATESRTIVVTGARTEQAIGDSAVATQVIRRAAIEASGAENLAELLEEHPGLQVLRSFGGAGGSGVTMQGLDPKYTLILVDGQRATGRVGGTLDLSRFPAEDIEQVEIVKGPASALYGSDAIAGVINIITRKTRRGREAEAHGSYGSFATQDLSGRVGLRRGRWGAGLAAGWHHTRGFDRDPSDVATTGNFQNNINLSQWTEFQARPDLKISLTADAQQRDLRGVDLSATGAVFDRRNLTRTASVTVAPEISWSAPARLRLIGHLAYFGDRYSLDQRGSDDLDDLQRTRDVLGQVTAQYDHLVAEKHLFTAGIEGQFEGLSTPRLELGRGARQRFALFVQDEWRVLPGRVVLVPGGRFDLDSQFGAYATPRLAVRVDPDPALTLRASAGLGYRAPSFRELYLSFANPSAGYRVAGNTELVPETSRGLTVGFVVRAASFAQLEVHAFANDLRNLITIDTKGGLGVGQSLFSYVNIGSARTRGVEAVFGLRVLRHFALDTSYTLSDTLDRQNHRPLPGKPLHHGSLRLQFHHRRSGTQAQARLGVQGSQSYYVDDGGDVASPVRVAPYATLDLRVAQDLLKGRMSLFVGVDNLLDAGDAGYLPLMPRAFYGGFTVRHRSP